MQESCQPGSGSGPICIPLMYPGLCRNPSLGRPGSQQPGLQYSRLPRVSPVLIPAWVGQILSMALNIQLDIQPGNSGSMHSGANSDHTGANPPWGQEIDGLTVLAGSAMPHRLCVGLGRWLDSILLSRTCTRVSPPHFSVPFLCIWQCTKATMSVALGRLECPVTYSVPLCLNFK